MGSARVVGLGKSGLSASRLLVRQGYSVVVSDRASGPALDRVRASLESEGITVQLGTDFDPGSIVDRPELVVVSPGVPWDSPGLVRARALGWTVFGEMELAWRSLPDQPWLAITGTNGKTTTTALTAAIFQAAGLQAPACGNIGEAACDLATARIDRSIRSNQSEQSGPDLDWVVAELSSYQIEAAPTIAPKIALWTTFTPDHLNRHYTLENYYNIKASLLARAEVAIFNGDDPVLRDQAPGQFPEALWTSVSGRDRLPAHADRGAWLEAGWVVVAGEPIVAAADLRMTGVHNQQNLLMAVLAARVAGLAPTAIAQAVRDFPGVAHRLEAIGTWQPPDENAPKVTFINDSKATNYDAADVGLTAVPGPVILIAGGEAKAGDDTAWLATIQAKAAAVLLIGSAAPAFAERLAAIGYDRAEIVETLEQAVPRAVDLARDRQAATVLLSPACASFDQFANFEARGDRFRQVCQTILAELAAS